jgi:hypothetical protein
MGETKKEVKKPHSFFFSGDLLNKVFAEKEKRSKLLVIKSKI